MDQKSLQRLLQHLPIPAIRFLEVTKSTNTDALDWSADGALDSSLVIADQQTAGRGRLGRKWFTHPNSALAFTVIFRPSVEERQKLSFFSPLGALAVCQAIQQVCNIQAQVKWPNDVLIHSKKVCGVLVETDWQEGTLLGLVMGIGINVTPLSIPSSSTLQFPTTSLESECGQTLDREQLLHSVLTNLFHLRRILCSEIFIKYWESKLAFRGEMVTLESTSEKTITGTFKGINKYGELLLLLESGEERSFQVGNMKLRPK